MRRCRDPAESIRQLARLCLRRGDEFRQSLIGTVGTYRKDILNREQLTQRDEVIHFVGQRCNDVRLHGDRTIGRERKRVSVRLRRRHRGCADRSCGAVARNDDDGLMQQLRQDLGEGARDNVNAAAGGERDDELNWTGRPRLLCKRDGA